MLNCTLTFLVIIEMTALRVLGLACLILVCFGLPAELIFVALKTPEERIKKSKKRELAIDKISYWDYLIVILPICLTLIIFFADDRNDRVFSLLILGIGYSGLLLSPYNRRIDIPRINIMVLLISALLFATVITIKRLAIPNTLNLREANILFAPIIAYSYLIIMRQIIKQLSGSYPITLDRYYSIGNFHERYNRKTNYSDLAWSFFNMIVFLGILIICF